MDVMDKVAIVTGASSGVGAELAVKLASMGARVAINYANSQAGAQQTLARVNEVGGRCKQFDADFGQSFRRVQYSC